MIEVRRYQFLAALNAIPNEEKQAYLEALSRCPRLLYRESCIDRFIASEEDFETAARRFVAYWENRKTVWTDGSAFLPLRLANGAMRVSDIGLLRLGWISILPRDRDDRNVCFLNLPHQINVSQNPITPQDRLRCMFYALQHLSEDCDARNKGIVLIIAYDDYCFEPTKIVMELDGILRVMPIRVSSLHIISRGEKQDAAKFFEGFVPSALKPLLTTNRKDEQDPLELYAHIHIGESLPALQKRLGQHGLVRENLPSALGGGWTATRQEELVERNLQEELRNSSETTARRVPQVLPFIFPDASTTTASSVKREVWLRLRDKNYSSQKRDRRRCRCKALHLQIKHLNNEKLKLQSESQRLEEFWKQANRLIEEGKQNLQGQSGEVSTRDSDKPMEHDKALTQEPKRPTQHAPVSPLQQVEEPALAAPSPHEETTPRQPKRKTNQVCEECEACPQRVQPRPRLLPQQPPLPTIPATKHQDQFIPPYDPTLPPSWHLVPPPDPALAGALSVTVYVPTRVWVYPPAPDKAEPALAQAQAHVD